MPQNQARRRAAVRAARPPDPRLARYDPAAAWPAGRDERDQPSEAFIRCGCDRAVGRGRIGALTSRWTSLVPSRCRRSHRRMRMAPVVLHRQTRPPGPHRTSRVLTCGRASQCSQRRGRGRGCGLRRLQRSGRLLRPHHGYTATTRTSARRTGATISANCRIARTATGIPASASTRARPCGSLELRAAASFAAVMPRPCAFGESLVSSVAGKPRASPAVTSGGPRAHSKEMVPLS